jgi:teichoic acid transport system permease protein
MISTLRSIFRDNWEWRHQIWPLARTELHKEVQGTVLGWLWLVISPAIYVGVLWVGLAIGLRNGSPRHGIPYVAYLTAGVIPWQFCVKMLTGGSNVYRRYSYLVNRLRFPIPVISTFFTLSKLAVFVLSLILVAVVMIVTGVGFSIYLLQLPILLLVMFLFWVTWSMMTSPLSAISKDFHNVIKAFSGPMFWISGVFFDISSIDSEIIKTILSFNPLAFFVSSGRACFVDNEWIWQRWDSVWPFLTVFGVMIILALAVQTRLASEVADVI